MSDDRYDSAAAFAVALRAALLDEPVAHDDNVIATVVDDEAMPPLTAAENVPAVARASFDELATESEGADVGNQPRVIPVDTLPDPIPRRSPTAIWFVLTAVVAAVLVLLLTR